MKRHKIGSGDLTNYQIIERIIGKIKDEILSNCPKDIYVIETKGVRPRGREVTLTTEKIITGVRLK